jgi:hypothetical protein
VDIVKQYPKDKEYRRFKVSPQAVRKIGEHAKGKGLGPDDLIFELRQDFDARPRLAVVPDPAAPGKTKPNDKGRSYDHGTLSAYSAGRCHCEHCRAAYALYRRERWATICRITSSLDPEERREIESAAREDQLTIAAFVADRALPGARHQAAAPGIPVLRETLGHLIYATGQLQRAGTNLNQAVAALNATGKPPGNLPQYAQSRLKYAWTAMLRNPRISRHGMSASRPRISSLRQDAASPTTLNWRRTAFRRISSSSHCPSRSASQRATVRALSTMSAR